MLQFTEKKTVFIIICWYPDFCYSGVCCSCKDFGNIEINPLFNP